MKYLTLWLDVESGDFDPKTSDLLEVGVYVDVQHPKIAFAGCTAKISKPTYRVTEQGMRANGINLDELRAEGHPVELLDPKMAEYVQAAADTARMHNLTLRVAGQFVQFDLDFLREQMPLTFAALDETGAIRMKVDTRSLSLSLQEAGLLPADVKCRLQDLAEHFGIKPERKHRAYDDARTACHVYAALLNLARK